MDRKTYEFTKKASRTAYEEAVRNSGGGGGTNPEPEPDPPFEWTAGVYPTKEGEYRYYRRTGGLLNITFANVPDVVWEEGKDYQMTHSKMGDLGVNTLLVIERSGNDVRLGFLDNPSWGTDGNGIFEVGTTMTLEEPSINTRIRVLEQQVRELLLR